MLALAGVLTALQLHEYAEGVVLPHEETLPKAKEDRFRLLSTAQAQFSPIFGIYDPGERREVQLARDLHLVGNRIGQPAGQLQPCESRTEYHDALLHERKTLFEAESA